MQYMATKLIDITFISWVSSVESEGVIFFSSFVRSSSLSFINAKAFSSGTSDASLKPYTKGWKSSSSNTEALYRNTQQLFN